MNYFTVVVHDPGSNRLGFGGDPGSLPLFCPDLFIPVMNYQWDSPLYYSPGGSAILGGGMRSTKSSLCVFIRHHCQWRSQYIRSNGATSTGLLKTTSKIV